MQWEDIDIQLWRYIDGDCSEQDKERIAKLIEKDEAWTIAYQELQDFNNTLHQHKTIQKTSEGFVDRAMDAISTPQAKTAKDYLNTWVTKSLVAFFIILISTILVYSLIQIDWSSSTETSNTPLFDVPDLTLPTTQWQPSATSLNILSFLVVLFIVIMIDKLIKHSRLKTTL